MTNTLLELLILEKLLALWLLISRLTCLQIYIITLVSIQEWVD